MRKSITLIAVVLCAALSLWADDKGGNTFFAARTDEDAACVLNGDWVTIQAFQPLVKPNGDWLSKGSAGGFVAYITITSDSDQPVKHTLVKEVQFNQDDKQQDLIRLNESMLLTNRLVIKQAGQPTVTALTIAFEYIGKKSPTAWGAGLQTMAKLVNVLPLPPNPYTSAAKSLAQFTSGVLDDSLAVDKPGTQDPKADLDLPFYGRSTMPTGKTRCQGNIEVGAYALIDAWPTNGSDDFVNINKPTDYCFWAEPGGGAGGVTFWFQKRQSIDPATGKCTGTGDLHILGNPHIPVLVTAVTPDDVKTKQLKREFNLPIGISRAKGKLMKEPLNRYSRRAQTSLRLCEQLKIPVSQCVGFDTSKLDSDSKMKLQQFEHNLLK